MYYCKICIRENRPRVYETKYKRDMRKHVSTKHDRKINTFGDVPGTLGGLGSVYAQPSMFTDS
jgi:hypothetical protein